MDGGGLCGLSLKKGHTSDPQVPHSMRKCFSQLVCLRRRTMVWTSFRTNRGRLSRCDVAQGEMNVNGAWRGEEICQRWAPSVKQY